MNAPLHDSLPTAQRRVTLDDKPHNGLHHQDTLNCAAAQRELGTLPCTQGGV